MSTPDEVLDAIDSTLADYAVSEDAMRWAPVPPPEPAFGYTSGEILRDVDEWIAARFEDNARLWAAPFAEIAEGLERAAQAVGEVFEGVTSPPEVAFFDDAHCRSISRHELHWGETYQPPPTQDIRPAAGTDASDAGTADAIIRWVDRHAENGLTLEPWQEDFVRWVLRDHGPDVLFVEVRMRWPLPSSIKAEYRRRRTARQRRRRR